jgi:hypothetical protein
MTQYRNVNNFLKSIGFEMPMTVEEYKAEKKAVIVCPNQHRRELAKTSLHNKISAFRRGAVDSFCADCSQEKDHKESEEKYIQEIEEKTGHRVITIDVVSRKVEYECGNCSEIGSSHITNLTTQNKGYCKSCENQHTKLTYDVLKAKVEEMGVVLLTKPEEYTNNKMLLSIICACGNEDKKRLADIRRGRGCEAVCKQRKYEETCLEKYGVRNASQDPVVFAKIMASIRRRKTYTFPSGREVIVQGYETYALDYLLEQQQDKFLGRPLTEDDIKVGVDVPRFAYTDLDGTQRTYFPDFYIAGMIVEVKGDWTLHKWKESNERKFQAVRESGYPIRLLLHYESGEIQEDRMVEGDLSDLEFRDKGRRY